MIVAVTGATGFVGRAVVDRAASSGLSLRALTRRAQPSRAGLTWIAGALDKPDSLATLVEGADAVLAASVFHFRTLTIGEVKDHLRAAGITVR